MEAIENILTRSSVREFSDQVVEREKVDLLLKVAFAAPSAVNRQPWHFVVVDQEQLRLELAQALPYCKMIVQSPLAIVVCGDKEKFLKGQNDLYWINDTSAASQNILLGAHALGLGAVWTAIYPEQDRVEAVGRILNLPDRLIPLSLIPIGYPVRQGSVKDKYQKNAVSYNRF